MSERPTFKGLPNCMSNFKLINFKYRNNALLIRPPNLNALTYILIFQNNKNNTLNTIKYINQYKL